MLLVLLGAGPCTQAHPEPVSTRGDSSFGLTFGRQWLCLALVPTRAGQLTKVESEAAGTSQTQPTQSSSPWRKWHEDEDHHSPQVLRNSLPTANWPWLVKAGALFRDNEQFPPMRSSGSGLAV